MSAGVADVLDRAADLLERVGWAQGDENAWGPCYCAMTAIWEVAGTDGGTPAAEALHRRLKVSSVSAWNDRPQRTAGQVIAKLREVAAQERAS